MKTAKAYIDETQKNVEELLDRARNLALTLISPDKRAEVDRQIGHHVALLHLRLTVNLIEELSKASRSWTHGSKAFAQQWRDLRNDVERVESDLEVSEPSSAEEFERGLMRLSQQRPTSSASLIEPIAQTPPFPSPLIPVIIQSLRSIHAKHPTESFKNRPSHDMIGEGSLLSGGSGQGTHAASDTWFLDSTLAARGRYRVFGPVDELDAFPAGVELIEKQGALAVVTASEDALSKLTRRFAVERLDLLEFDRPGTEFGLPASQWSPVDSKTAPISPPTVTSMFEVIITLKASAPGVWKKAIEEAGACLLEPAGVNSFIVEVPSPEVLRDLQGMKEIVGRVEFYKPDIRWEYLDRYASSLKENRGESERADLAAPEVEPSGGVPLPGILSATFFSSNACSKAAEQLSVLGITILERPTDYLLVFDVLSAGELSSSLRVIRSLEGLRSVEEESIPVVSNNIAREVIGEGVIFPALPWTGKDEIIGIADTGLDTGVIHNIHPDFSGRIKDLKSYPISPYLSSQVDNPNDDDGPIDKYSGHGTHVAGSALGSGMRAQNRNLDPVRGMAPEATLVFQAIEQSPRWNREGRSRYERIGLLPPSHGLFGLPIYLPRLFEDAYGQGARIHSNSWNDLAKGLGYTRLCTELDEFVWNHKDFLIVVSAGNYGRKCPSTPGKIALGSMYPPATAKNCLTVGASENQRGDQFCRTYGSRYPGLFGDAPFDTDGFVDSVDDIAPFSSRGPCPPDGRRKPDVVAPGTLILSTRSRQIPTNNHAEAPFPPDDSHYMYMSGTSMATPLVAGAAALVRQFLRSSRDTDYSPSAAILKAAIIHSAEYFDYRYRRVESRRSADNEQGWGRVNLKNILTPRPPTQVVFIDERKGLNDKETAAYEVEITDPNHLFRVTLAYSDYRGPVLINNVNLLVFDPAGRPHRGNDFDGSLERDNKMDTVNNVEGVLIDSAATGTWKIWVIGSNVTRETQDFALVASGAGLRELGSSRF